MKFARCLAACPFLAFFLSAASAVPVEIQYQDPAGSGFFDTTPATAVGGNTGTTLGAQRRIALEYALQRWGKNIQGSIAIRVRAISLSTPRSSLTLASARPLAFRADWTQGTAPPLAGVAYPSALSTELAGVDIPDNAGSTYDIQVNNIPAWDTTTPGNFDQRVWYYGLDSQTPSDVNGNKDFDFVGVMLHEFCHGLGFSAGLNTDGSYLYGIPNVWDSLLTDSAGTALTAMSQSSRAAMLIGNNLYTGGSILRGHNSNNRAKVFAPNPYQAGSSISHFDETTYSGTGSLNEMMTPVNSFGTQVFGPLVFDMLQDMGYQMADTLPPVAGIDVPVSGRGFKSSPTPLFSGTATDTAAAGNNNAAGLLAVKVALYGNSQGKWYNWGTGSFDSGTFTYANHTTPANLQNLPIAVGSRAWSMAMPAGLPEGGYQIAVTAVDQINQGSEFIYNDFTIDNTASPIQVTPFAENAQVFDLQPMRFVSNGAQSVTVQISKVTGGVTTVWNGSAWVSGTAPALATSQESAGVFKPSFNLPGRADWPAGSTLTIVGKSVDTASNVATATIHLTRTAVDSSVPDVAFLSLASGTVFTESYLPALSGTAADLQSGIKSVTLSLARFLTGGGVVFWNGSDWSASPTDLPTSYDAESGVWSAPYNWALPSNSSLPNASYSMQVTATNGETPGGTRGVGVSFTVDHHDVYTWTGATFRDSDPYNDSYFWGTAENWYPYGVPDVGDIAVIDNGDTVQSTVSRTVYSLRLLDGGLNFTNGPGSFGTLTTAGGSKWGNAYFNGVWNNPAGATLDLQDGGFYLMAPGSKLENSGTVNRLSSSGYFRDNGPGGVVIDNLAGATFNLAGDGTPFADYYGGNVFNNAGTFNRNAGPNPVGIQAWVFNNTGTIRADAPTLQFDTALNLNAGSTFAGSGPIKLNSTTNVNSALVIPANVSFTGGSFNCPGGVSISGDFQWVDGIFNGQMAIPAGTTLNLAGGALKLLNPGSVINNSGTIVWNGAGGYLRDNGPGGVTINNLADGTFNLAADGSPFEDYYGGNVFNNAGAFKRTGGTDPTSLHAWVFNNTGSIRCDSSVLQFDGVLNLNSGSILTGSSEIHLNSTTTVNAPLAIPPTVSLTGGMLNCPGGVVISGNFHWLDGILNGQLTIPAGSALDLTGTGIKLMNPGSVLSNSGTIRWNGGGSYVRDNGPGGVTINNLAGGIFDLAADGSPFENYYGGNIFNNAGTLVRSGGTDPVSIHAWTVNNSNIIRCDASVLQFDTTLNLNAGTTFTGSATIKLNNTTNVNSAAVTLPSLVSLTGGSLLSPQGVSVGGNFEWVDGILNGRLDVPAGAILNLTGGATKVITPGSVINNSGTINADSGSYLRDNGPGGVTINNLAGSVFNAGDGSPFENYYGGNTFNNAGSFVKNTGTGSANVHAWIFNNTGKIIATTGDIVFDGGEVDLNAGGLIMGAKVVHFSASTTYLHGTTTCSTGNATFDGANLSGNADGTGTLAGGPWIWNSGPFGGTIKIAATGSLTLPGGDFRWLTSGTVLDNSGTIKLTDTGSLRGDGNCTVRNRPGALFTAAGSAGFSNYYSGNVFINDGTVTIGSPLAQWSMDWDFTQSASGVMNVEIAGPSAAEFDRLSVAGTATLGGTVNVTKLNGYAPAQDTTFGFLTAGNVVGSFATVNGGFASDYSATTATLRVAAGFSYETWVAAAGLTGNNALRGADPDADGMTNFAEYVFNTNPVAGNPSPLITGTTHISGQIWLTLSYRRWADREAAGVVYTPQSSTGLSAWGAAGVVDEADTGAVVVAGSTAYRCRIPASGARGFLRVMAVQP